MDASESRFTTIVMGCIAGASVAGFAAVFAPTLLSIAPGSGIRPWGVLPLLTLMFGSGWWIACLVMGIRQLFVRPRRYGLYTIGFGALQLAAFGLTEWLLVGSRGHYWAP